MSGLVKGVKKVFKAIGSVVKKILKSPIFKAILIAAAVIFTGGAAIGAFGAMGAAGATFGSVMSGALAGGIAPFSAALSALSGAASSIGSALGLTSAAPGAAAAALPFEAGFVGTEALSGAIGAGEAVAGGAAVAEGAAGIAANGGVDAMAAYAAEAAAPGAASWSGAAQPFSLGTAAPEALAGAKGAGQSFTPQALQLTQPATTSGGGWMSNVGTSQLSAQNMSGGMINTAGNSVGAAPTSNSFSLWDFLKPSVSSKEGQLLIGQTLMGAARGISDGREAQEQRDYRAARSVVPRNERQYEAIPGHAAWALSGGK